MRHRASACLLAFVVLAGSATASPSTADAWAGAPGYRLCLTHGWMTFDALVGLEWDTSQILGFPPFYYGIHEEADEVDIVMPHPDRACHRAKRYQDLYEEYDGSVCTLKGAEWYASQFLQQARQAYASGHLIDAKTYLGWAAHFIQDALCPPHVFPFKQGQTLIPLHLEAHTDFEEYTARVYPFRSWPSLVRAAPIESISTPAELRNKIVEAAAEVRRLPCDFEAQDGTFRRSNPDTGELDNIDSPPSDGWDMADEDI